MTVNAHMIPDGESRPAAWPWIAGTAAFVITWVALYAQLPAFSDWVVSVLPLERGWHFEEAVRFFVYDRRADGQRGGVGPAVCFGWLKGRPDLPRLWTRRRHHRRVDHRATAS